LQQNLGFRFLIAGNREAKNTGSVPDFPDFHPGAPALGRNPDSADLVYLFHLLLRVAVPSHCTLPCSQMAYIPLSDPPQNASP